VREIEKKTTVFLRFLLSLRYSYLGLQCENKSKRE